MRRWQNPVQIIAAALIALGLAQAAQAGGKAESVVRYGPDYEGYHLRPPYFLPGVGWYTPPDFKDRSLYFGYHFHPAPGPETPWSRKRAVRVSADHAEWCRGTYRSYRASDNTFRTQDGRRKTCRSPYWRG